MTVKNDFPLLIGAFLEKHQVEKLDLVGKSFLTVILCYRIDAFLAKPPLTRPRILRISSRASSGQRFGRLRSLDGRVLLRHRRGFVRRADLARVDLGLTKAEPLAYTWQVSVLPKAL